tara:strand:+ start:513 stop:758 length:246 start_codon:yes stop_codon:yes gene_type:complete
MKFIAPVFEDFHFQQSYGYSTGQDTKQLYSQPEVLHQSLQNAIFNRDVTKERMQVGAPPVENYTLPQLRQNPAILQQSAKA